MFRRHPAISHKVLVSLYSDNAIEGVLTKTVGNFLVVQGAVIHQSGSDPTPADGEIVIDTANVDYVQKL